MLGSSHNSVVLIKSSFNRSPFLLYLYAVLCLTEFNAKLSNVFSKFNWVFFPLDKTSDC